MSGIEQAVLVQSVGFSEVAAWGLIAGGVVYAIGHTRIPKEGAAALAVATALLAKAALLPLI